MNTFYPDRAALISFDKTGVVTVTPSRKKHSRETTGIMDALWWHDESRTQERVFFWLNDPVCLDVEKGDVIELWEYVLV